VTEKGRDLLGVILGLDPSERAWLAREVVASLDGTEPTETVEAAWSDELRRRVADIERGTVALENWAQTRERLLNRNSS
jgi:putative addiction module component (TIGR02574 family)